MDRYGLKKAVEVEAPLHSCVEPNWWLKPDKRAAVRQTSISSTKALSNYSTLERRLIHTVLFPCAQPKAFIMVNKQESPFSEKIYSDICPRTLSVRRSEQFFETEDQGKELITFQGKISSNIIKSYPKMTAPFWLQILQTVHRIYWGTIRGAPSPLPAKKKKKRKYHAQLVLRLLTGERQAVVRGDRTHKLSKTQAETKSFLQGRFWQSEQKAQAGDHLHRKRFHMRDALHRT